VAERFVCAVHGIVPRDEVRDSAPCGRVHTVPVGEPHTLDTGEPCYAIGLPGADLGVKFTRLDEDGETGNGPQG